MMHYKAENLGKIVEVLLRKTQEHYDRHDHRPIPWSLLKSFVGRQAVNAGGFDAIIQALLDDHSIKLVTLETGKRFIAPGTAVVSEIQPVKFTVEPS